MKRLCFAVAAICLAAGAETISVPSGKTVTVEPGRRFEGTVLVKEGEGMTAPLSQCWVFPPMVVSMVEVGEETGALAEMLTRIANTYDDEVDNAVAGMTAAIEPALIIVLAVVVGTIVIAMFLPMIKIISSVSGAGA